MVVYDSIINEQGHSVCMTKKNHVHVLFDDDTISRIDFLIEKKKFDNRAQFVRRATIELLEQFETKILA